MFTLNEDGHGVWVGKPNTGMSLRDYFAAHAPITLEDAERDLDAGNEVTSDVILTWLAQMRYAYADAMLVARAV